VRRGLLRWSAMTSFQFAQLMFVTQSVLIGAAVSLTSQAFSADGGDRLSGIASVYDQSSGAQTASGEPLREEAMTAAHRSLPFGTVVRVINRQNGQAALVRINDRGPFVRGRVIDLSPAAGRVLGLSGLAEVSLEIVSSDRDEQLSAISVTSR
jgi:peptidoglycan lytic transglycosylase